MSIIHDALKKVEKSKTNLDLKVSTEKKPQSKIQKYLTYALVVCLGFFIGSIFLSLIGKSLKNKSAILVKNKPSLPATPQPATDIKVAPKPEAPASPVIETTEPLPDTFVLNGVFFSQAEGYALVNNQIVKEGERVNGATVVKITLNQVELTKEGSTIKLSNPSR